LPKEKSSEFVELVKSDSRIDVDDLRLVLTARLEFHSSIWIFGMGLAVTIAVVTTTLPNDPIDLAAKYSLAIAVAALYLGLLRRDPEKMIKRILLDTDYLDAKKMIEDQRK
jgi:hypothetical protein